jgi:hypothetical protein
MKKYRDQEVIKTLLEAVVCNGCGKSIQHDDIREMNKMNGFTATFGYDSKHDWEVWRFDLCEECLEKIIDQFVVPVDINEQELPF